jgi:hypothetical protein
MRVLTRMLSCSSSSPHFLDRPEGAQESEGGDGRIHLDRFVGVGLVVVDDGALDLGGPLQAPQLVEGVALDQGGQHLLYRVFVRPELVPAVDQGDRPRDPHEPERPVD